MPKDLCLTNPLFEAGPELLAMCLGWSFGSMEFIGLMITNKDWVNPICQSGEMCYISDNHFDHFKKGGMRFLQILMNTWSVPYHHFTLVWKSVMFLKNMGIYLQIVSLIDMWNDRRHLVLSMFRQLLDPCAHRHGVNRSTPSKFDTATEKRMVGRLLSFWDGKIFRGYVKHRECMIKALKSINCPWGLKDFCFGGPFAFSRGFLLLSGCTVLEGSGNDGVYLMLLLKCSGFTNWYLIFF